MIRTFFTTIFASLIVGTTPLSPTSVSIPSELSSRQISLSNRHAVTSVNEVMKKNILLNVAYLNKSVEKKQDISWDTITRSFSTYFILQPGDVFAYHDHVLPEYEGTVDITTNAHFSSDEGFLTDGYLYGDGVCHLASIINWAAQDAGLLSVVTKNHNFAAIPEVPKEYGVSIYTNKTIKGSGSRNNLYITNTKDIPVQFTFTYANDTLKVSVSEVNTTTSS